MIKRRKIFIVSSSEALPQAKQLKDALNDVFANDESLCFGAEVWADFFDRQNFNDSFWRTLTDKAQELKAGDGYAVVLWTYDDHAIIRNAYYRIARDNVQIEFGLFCGALGPEKVFYFSEGNKQQRTPSDLLGIRWDKLRYSPSSRDSEHGGNIDLESAVKVILGRLPKGPELGDEAKQNPVIPDDIADNPNIDRFNL